MSYQNSLERVEQQSRQVTREAAKMLSAHEQAWRQSEQVTREAARTISTLEQVGREVWRIAPVLDRIITEIGQQSELKWFANQILESERKQKAKLPTPNTSNYCREWDWDLYSLTDYHLYYANDPYFVIT